MPFLPAYLTRDVVIVCIYIHCTTFHITLVVVRLSVMFSLPICGIVLIDEILDVRGVENLWEKRGCIYSLTLLTFGDSI